MEQSGGEERPARLLIHDREIPFAREGEYGAVVRPDSPIRPCTGCFGCWVRTPGQCVIRDALWGYGGLASPNAMSCSWSASAAMAALALLSRMSWTGASGISTPASSSREGRCTTGSATQRR